MLIPRLLVQIKSLIKAREHFNKNLHLEDIGLYPISYLPVISYIEPKSPAMQSGIKINDKIVAVDGKEINNWFVLANIIQNSVSKVLNISIIRNNKPMNLNVTPIAVDNDGQVSAKLGIMPSVDTNLLVSNSFSYKYNILSGFKYAALSCYELVKLNITSIYSIISGHSSINNLGGPISIAKAANGALTNGATEFIDFLALISIGLGIMNLLPLPVLDGGHIIIYLIEWAIGKEVTYQTQSIIFKIGFVLIMGITIIAFYNDILRLS